MVEPKTVDNGRYRSTARLVAHELQGPMTVILGCVSMLRDPTLPQEARDAALDMIEGEARGMGGLVQSLLGSFEVGSEGARREQFDVCQVVREVVASARAQAQLDGATIEPLGLDKAPLPVEAVPGHVRCILSNLVRNGLAYSLQPARIFIEIRGRRDEGAGIEIAVHDHGLGIPRADQEHIFEAGYRVRDSIPGSGLGLTISRELAEQNGGILRLERSEPFKGSVFVLSLPRTAAPRRGAQLPRPNVPPSTDRQLARSAGRSVGAERQSPRSAAS